MASQEIVEQTEQKHEQIERALCEIFVDRVQKEEPVNLRDFIAGVEKTILLRILEATNFNQRVAAKVMGVKPTTLCEKIRKYHIGIHKRRPLILSSRLSGGFPDGWNDISASSSTDL